MRTFQSYQISVPKTKNELIEGLKVGLSRTTPRYEFSHGERIDMRDFYFRENRQLLAAQGLSSLRSVKLKSWKLSFHLTKQKRTVTKRFYSLFINRPYHVWPGLNYSECMGILPTFNHYKKVWRSRISRISLKKGFYQDYFRSVWRSESGHNVRNRNVKISYKPCN